MDFDGPFDLDVVAGVDEEAVGNRRLVQRGELGGAETGFLFHEMRRHEIAVGDERLGERQADHAFWKLGFGMSQLVIHKNELRGGFFQAGRT